jgi:hypothetical protein
VLWRAFSGLRLHAVRARMGRMAVARFNNGRVAQCFEAWRARAAYRAHLRARAVEVMLRTNRWGGCFGRLE